MFSKVNSGGLHGIDGCLIQVEADVSTGLPGFQLVGFLASEVKEAQDRVRTALKNSGFSLPPMKVTINLSPADIRKEGTAFDLPIAVAVLAAHGLADPMLLADSAFVGELGLDGSIKPVKGTLPLVSAFRDAGLKRCFLPVANVREGLAIGGIHIIKAENLRELAQCLNEPQRIQPEVGAALEASESEPDCAVDYREVNGQFLLRRAAEIAAAGHHNLIIIGPAGSGKSMVARRIPTIMPPMSESERLEISKVYSVCGLIPPGEALVSERPFRSPHHTISPQALIGGGMVPKPGEITLASGGVLFLDEFPEFQRRTIEALRQPLEEHRIQISRAHGCCEFPARFMLVAAMNPCPCGFYPDRNRCSCDESQVRRYMGRISRPMLDRMDLCVEAAPVTYREARGMEANDSSAAIRSRVTAAWKLQEKRFQKSEIHFNSEMGNREIRNFCALNAEEEDYLQEIYQKLKLSVRGCHKILKVARTIADLEERSSIEKRHLGEAAGYRSLEEKYWGREG